MWRAWPSCAQVRSGPRQRPRCNSQVPPPPLGPRPGGQFVTWSLNGTGEECVLLISKVVTNAGRYDLKWWIGHPLEVASQVRCKSGRTKAPR